MLPRHDEIFAPSSCHSAPLNTRSVHLVKTTRLLI